MIQAKIDNGKTEVMLSGSMITITAEILTLIGSTYDNLQRNDRLSAGAFRSMIIAGVTDEKTPIWNGIDEKNIVEDVHKSFRAGQIKGNDISDLVKAGATPEAIAAILRENEKKR